MNYFGDIVINLHAFERRSVDVFSLANLAVKVRNIAIFNPPLCQVVFVVSSYQCCQSGADPDQKNPGRTRLGHFRYPRL